MSFLLNIIQHLSRAVFIKRCVTVVYVSLFNFFAASAKFEAIIQFLHCYQGMEKLPD